MWSSPKNAGSQQKLKEVKNLHAKQETLVLFLALEDQLEEGKATHSFPCDAAGKESACNAGDLSPIPGLGRSPGEGKGYPLQWPQDWKRSVFIPIPKKGNAKECSNYRTIALTSHGSKLMLKKFSKPGFNST